MDQRNEKQQPDAPEPQNRVQNAVDILLDPSISRMREQRNGMQNVFFSPRGSNMREVERSLLRMTYGPEVLGPFPLGQSTLIPPNPNPN
jgi:hypothetical protein